MEVIFMVLVWTVIALSAALFGKSVFNACMQGHHRRKAVRLSYDETQKKYRAIERDHAIRDLELELISQDYWDWAKENGDGLTTCGRETCTSCNPEPLKPLPKAEPKNNPDSKMKMLGDLVDAGIQLEMLRRSYEKNNGGPMTTTQRTFYETSKMRIAEMRTRLNTDTQKAEMRELGAQSKAILSQLGTKVKPLTAQFSSGGIVEAKGLDRMESAYVVRFKPEDEKNLLNKFMAFANEASRVRGVTYVQCVHALAREFPGSVANLRVRTEEHPVLKSQRCRVTEFNFYGKDKVAFWEDIYDEVSN